MSLNKVNSVKTDKGFKIWDLIIYAVLAVVIVALFIALNFALDKSAVSEFTVYYGDDAVYVYSFETNEGTVIDEKHIQENQETDQGLYLTFYGADSSEYNIIYIDKTEKSVNVTDANCSTFKKDCVYTVKITDKSQLITCMPHGMKIQPNGYEIDPDAPIVVG